MTVLVQTYQDITSQISLGDLGVARLFSFARINRGNIVTFCLLGCVITGIIAYLAALYVIFSAGMRLQTENRLINRLTDETNALELDIQRYTANFSAEHKDTLSAMEKISQTDYISEEGTAVSYASPSAYR